MWIGGLLPIAFLAFLVWVVVRAVRGRRQGPAVDTAASVRRFVLYALLFGSLVLLASGLTSSIGQLLEDTSVASDRAATVARALAFVIVGAPAFLLLGRHALGQLRSNDEERRSVAWSGYLNLVLAVSLIVVIVQKHAVLRAWANDGEFDGPAFAAILVWGGVWAAHWLWLRPRFGIEGDLHLAFGSVTGLIATLVGSVGLIQRAGDQVLDTELSGRPSTWSWIITLAIGAGVWAFFWVFAYQESERTTLWDVVVLFPGTLVGLIMTVVSAASAAYLVAVWFLGDRVGAGAREHFEATPALLGAFVVGALSWMHHHRVLDARSVAGTDVREDPIRARDYLVAGASLVTAIVGAVSLLVALFESIAVDAIAGEIGIINRVLLAVILLAIGVALWWHTWGGLQRRIDSGDAEEHRAPIRRIYLLVLFGIGGVVAVAALLTGLTGSLEDLIEGTLGRRTLENNRFALALVLTVSGVAWYHLLIFRRDRHELQPPPPPAVVPQRLTGRRLVVVAPEQSALPGHLAAAGATLTHWVRTDTSAGSGADAVTGEAVYDPAEMVARIESMASIDLLIVSGPGGVDVVPFRV